MGFEPVTLLRQLSWLGCKFQARQYTAVQYKHVRAHAGLQVCSQMVCITSHTCTLTCWKSKERRLFNCSSRLVQAFLPEASTTIHRHCMQAKHIHVHVVYVHPNKAFTHKKSNTSKLSRPQNCVTTAEICTNIHTSIELTTCRLPSQLSNDKGIY